MYGMMPSAPTAQFSIAPPVNRLYIPSTPPPVAPLINAAFTLPDFRNGQAQVYALSKDKLIHGQLGPVVAFDSASVPVPAGSGTSAIWSSLQPAHSPPGDHSTPPVGGAEFFGHDARFERLPLFQQFVRALRVGALDR